MVPSMRYLDPKNDLAFKKVFGQHPHLLKSFLNALLPNPKMMVSSVGGVCSSCNKSTYWALSLRYRRMREFVLLSCWRWGSVALSNSGMMR